MRNHKMGGLKRITAVAMGVCLYGMSTEGTARAQTAPTAPSAGALRIVVLQGEDAVNILKDNQTASVIVQVLDSRNLPVSDATVRFTMPAAGAGGTFSGQLWYTTFTNDAGRARPGALKLRGAGAFRIDVTATYANQTAETSLTQITFATAKAVNVAGRAFVAPQGAGVSNRRSGESVGKRVLKGAAAVGIAAGIAFLFSRPSTAGASYPSYRQPSNYNWACGTWCDPHFNPYLP